jgi:galactokinase
MLNDPIPIVKQTQLDQIYSNNLKYQQKRYQQLTTKFREQFGIDPTFIARSPGRCNTIGEHIDYSGYSVLPMAIEKDCIMAIATFQEEEATVTLANTNPKYPTRTIKHEAGVHVTIDSSEHEWSNYFKCGYKGVLDELNPVKVVSLKIMVDGTVPAVSKY